MVGTIISHYKVLEKIGQGGMGEVYRATDTKLNRDVALKILPEQFASDSQRMGRFQREAEVLASLDHPNTQPSSPPSQLPPRFELPSLLSRRNIEHNCSAQ